MPDLFSTPPGLSQIPSKAPTWQYRIGTAMDALRGKFPQPATPQPKPISAPEPQPQVKTQDDVAGKGFPDANYLSALFRNYQELFTSGTTRQRRYQEYNNMDSGIVASLLDAVVDACLISDDGKISGFAIDAKPKYQNILEQVAKDLDLKFSVRQILRDVMKFGDVFVAPIFDENWNIVDFESPPPEQMYAFVDERMRLLTGTEKIGDATYPLAYQQKGLSLVTVAGWYPWQMYHIKWSPSKRTLYSTKSLLEDMRSDWYKMRLVDESLVMFRVMRAAPRNVHTLDTTGKTPDEAQKALDNYVNQLSNKKMSNGQFVKDTISVDEDLFITSQFRQAPNGDLVPSLNGVKTIDPRNSGLAINDVNYLNKKLFTRVPSELVGILPERNDISTQDIAASRMYAFAQQFVLEKQFLRPLFDTALRLRGYKPEEDDYKIIFPNVQIRSSWRWGDANFRISLSESADIEAGIDNRKHVAKQKHGWTEEDWSVHEQEWSKEQQTFGALPNATKPALIRQGQKGSSPESTATPEPSLAEAPLDTARREYAEATLPLLKELRELRAEMNLMWENKTPAPPEIEPIPTVLYSAELPIAQPDSPRERSNGHHLV